MPVPPLSTSPPSHQFPLGGTLPVQRRIELLRYAHGRSSYVIEEDYDGDFRYDSPPVSSVQGLCPDRVIYVGTFSMTVFPSLRIGFIVAPPKLVPAMRDAKRMADIHAPAAPQLALARFMKDGHFARHLAAMRKGYGASRGILLDSLDRHFGGHACVLGSASGLHVCVRFPGSVSRRPCRTGSTSPAWASTRWNTMPRRKDIGRTRSSSVSACSIRVGSTPGIAILKRCLPAS